MSEAEALELKSAIVKPKRKVEKDKAWWVARATRLEIDKQTVEVELERVRSQRDVMDVTHLTLWNIAVIVFAVSLVTFAVGVLAGWRWL